MHTLSVTGALRATVAAAALAAAALAQSPLTIGNVFIVRVGDGVAALSNAATATFLDEYTPTGTLVQSIPMPTTASGLNQPLTNSGTATSEGFLNVSLNGIYLTLAGYSAAPGLAAVAGTTAASTPRVIARVDLTGAVDTSTTITDGYNGVPPVPPATSFSSGNPRAVVTADGNQFWTSGTGTTANAGVRFVLFGGSTSVGLNAGAPSNTRVVGTYDNRLFTTSASTVYQSVCQVGAGLPTTTGQSISVLPGLPNVSGPSAYDFFFADPNTLYIADDRAVLSNGGIQKYSLIGGTWTFQYILGGAPCRGITGRKANGVTTLWATTGSALISVVDSGAGSTPTTLVTAPPNQALRGVRYLGKPTTVTRVAGGCGTADISTVGNAEIGTDVTTTVLNPTGIPFIIYGTSVLGLPLLPCGCTLIPSLDVVNQASQTTLSLPLNVALIGVQIATQGMDFLAPQSCIGLTLALTDAYTFTIQ